MCSNNDSDLCSTVAGWQVVGFSAAIEHRLTRQMLRQMTTYQERVLMK